MLPPKTPQSRRNSSGLVRDLEILELLAEAQDGQEDGLGVVRLAQLTGRDKAVISRTLATLEDSQILERDESSLAYRLGSRLYALAARTVESTMVTASRPMLRQLVQSTRETSHLCVLRGGNVLTLVSELSPYEFRAAGWEGITTAAWRTPSGRVLISRWAETALRKWYDEHGHDAAVVGSLGTGASRTGFAVLPVPPKDKAIVHNFASLKAELEHIRSRGYATLDEELEHGVVGASAPVFDFTGNIIAAVNVSGPKARIGDRLEALGALVARSADELSKHLGRRP
ncbi:MAG: IclR family transcriptional regulator [Lacisediminihabitans sp.]